MNEWLEFDVVGIPTPQGSKRAYVRGGRVNLVEQAGAALKTWRAEVADAARAAITAADWYPVDAPVEVHVLFRMARPKARPDDVWHAVRPDVDKLVRAVLDALSTAGVWEDDCLVADMRTWKRYAVDGTQPGASIAVRVIP